MPHHVEASADPCRKRHRRSRQGIEICTHHSECGTWGQHSGHLPQHGQAGMATDHRPGQCPHHLPENRWQSGKLSRFGWATWPGISLPWKRWPCWSGDSPINTGTTYGSKRPWQSLLLRNIRFDFSGMPRFCSAAWGTKPRNQKACAANRPSASNNSYVMPRCTLHW